MRLLYVLAEILVLWVLLAVLGGLIIWGWSGFDELGQLLLLGYLVVSLGGAIRLVLIGNDHSLWTGFYRPVRLLSLMLPGIGALIRDSKLGRLGRRTPFAFDFQGNARVSAYDVVDALSDSLTRQGIGHRKSSGLLVDDNGTTWWLEADLGTDRVSGWVESPNRANRDQIISAIRSFLERDMGLRVA